MAEEIRPRALRVLGSVGEPINPEAWEWYYRVTGSNKPIMDTWWQTETGMILISPLPTVPLKPGSATRPFLGMEADVVDRQGKSLPPNAGGFAVINEALACHDADDLQRSGSI